MEAKYLKLRDLVLEKNQVLNLTAITEPEEFYLKHVTDSLILTSLYPLLPGQKIADLGTGAGFPGLPLAIAYPEATFHLMDSVKKKLTFIEDAVMQLGLQNVKVFHGRFEDLAHQSDLREQYDVVVSRAVASLPVLLEYMVGFAKPTGKIICFKSMRYREELAESGPALKALSIELTQTLEYPLGDATMALLVFEKTKPTKAKYPRKAGTPKRQPL